MRGERLQAALDGYAKFLCEKDLAPPKHQPHLVRWVREFLQFARVHGSYTFEQTLDLFLTEVGGRVGIKPWQVQQAADAVRIYRYQYRVRAWVKANDALKGKAELSLHLNYPRLDEKGQTLVETESKELRVDGVQDWTPLEVVTDQIRLAADDQSSGVGSTAIRYVCWGSAVNPAASAGIRRCVVTSRTSVMPG